jgi:hypothetical protein
VSSAYYIVAGISAAALAAHRIIAVVLRHREQRRLADRALRDASPDQVPVILKELQPILRSWPSAARRAIRGKDDTR